jgi:hypothetical protein
MLEKTEIFGSGFKTSDQVQGPRLTAGFHIYFYQNYGVQQAQADRESAVRHTFWRMSNFKEVCNPPSADHWSILSLLNNLSIRCEIPLY